MPNDLKKFREAGVDAFTGGFQVRTARSYTRKPQIWANSDAEIRKLLLTAFPKQATNPTQRKRAGRWARIIHFYYRLSYTYAQVAQEMNMTKGSVLTTTRSINRARKGLTARTGKIRSSKPPHRPKKKGVPYIPCTMSVAKTTKEQ